MGLVERGYRAHIARAAEQAMSRKCRSHHSVVLQLVIPQRGGRLLLGKKLRGFGAGYINGFGGKVEIGESIEEGARRELEEEAGISARVLDRRGVLTFHFDDRLEPWEVHGAWVAW